jgi:septum formation protein
MPELILASKSPNRARLLSGLGYAFTTQPADVDETPLPHEAPLAYVKRIAIAKAQKVAAENPGKVILAADTPVAIGRRILQTPQTAEEAEAMLKLQSGRRVHISTVVVVINAEGRVRSETVASWLKIKRLTPADMAKQLEDTENWQHAAGALKIEKPLFQSFVQTLHGSMSGIIGLPLYETAKLLTWAGVQPE